MSQTSDSSTSANPPFIPPRHWIGVEELNPSYWEDPQIREKRGQEFYEKPVEMIDFIDRTDKKGLARRDFLTVMGASMAMASFSCARRPVHKIIPYVIKPEEITPGVPTWYASTSRECHCGCGLLVKTREGRPIKLEGNPDHPVNQGKLCVRGQASILNLYDPDRLQLPISHPGRSGRSDTNWTDVDNVIGGKLKGASRVRILTGAMKSPSTTKLIHEFLSSFRSGEHIEYEPIGFDDIAQAQERSYGTAVVPEYRFDRAEVILSLGADFMGTWVSPVEHAAAWARGRKLQGDAKNAKLSKFYMFETTVTNTGASADERYGVRPGDEFKIAMAIAHELIVARRATQFSADRMFASMLASYQPEAVAAEIGLPGGAALIRRIADDLWNARGKSIVVGGGPASRDATGVRLQVAVNLLNSALENEGATVDGTLGTTTASTGLAGITRLIGEMNQGAVDVLIIYRSNPIYTLPPELKFAEAMKKVGLVIAVTDHDDETARQSDFVLADHHYLENWGDWQPKADLLSLQQPVIAPIHNTRAFEDTLLTWMKRDQTWHDYLRANWQKSVYASAGAGADFELFWEGVLRKGVFDTRATKGLRSRGARGFRPDSFAGTPAYAASSLNPDELQLVLYPKVTLYDGCHANNPWLQETPDPIAAICWDNYLNLAPSRARTLGVKDDDVVEVTLGETKMKLPVHVQPGLHPSVGSVALGYGRTAAGKVGNGAGVDVYPTVKVQDGQPIFAGQIIKAARTQEFYRLASTQWHTVTENRPVLNDITLAEYRRDPRAALETDPEIRPELASIWPKHEYKGYRWGMTIDLNSCMGCGACTVACQAENNVPVVGRDQVRNSRQMQWIRIDRYYSGDPANPGVAFQPMLCQHCENAPCETVCPVLATVHDDEGLNVQVYNRCVGTRYCQNNCPYKVRRFNFFDHWKSYEGTMNLAWNPDVTVRTRGIMEKCTMCVQRIREGKDKAKDLNEKVADGAIKTACQQTCPTDAIVFGDINDSSTEVSKLRSPRAFFALDVLNTKPTVAYLTKVRNITEQVEENHHG